MKSKETKKTFEDFGPEKINEQQVNTIKGGGQGSSIVEENAEGI